MILEVNNLRKTFVNGTKALQGVNFSINYNASKGFFAAKPVSFGLP